MNLTIHSGTHTIGGNCVEVKTDTTRMLIDVGIPLTDEEGNRNEEDYRGKTADELVAQGLLPDIPGVFSAGETDIDAILISHSQLDHYGFLEHVNPDVDVYMSAGCKAMIDASNIFIRGHAVDPKATIVKPGKHFRIGDITVTPYLVDHSAFGALAFLIESGGKRVFYTGDMRGHGRKSNLFDAMIKNPPEGIDLLIAEGTVMGAREKMPEKETALQSKIEKILRGTDNITFLFTSAQNIDRMVTAYKACRRTNSIFVVDLYTAFILDKANNISKDVPKTTWSNIRIKHFQRHIEALEKWGYSNLLYHYGKRKIDIFEISRKRNRILMLARDNSIFPAIIKKVKNTEGAIAVYSMYHGYLKEKFTTFCQNKRLAIEEVHTSGHISLRDLEKLVGAIKPGRILPVHTVAANRFSELWGDKVIKIKNGESIEV